MLKIVHAITHNLKFKAQNSLEFAFLYQYNLFTIIIQPMNWKPNRRDIITKILILCFCISSLTICYFMKVKHMDDPFNMKFTRKKFSLHI